MDLRKIGILAACLALPVSARAPRWAPARETARAELVEKSATGISPIPTSNPELAAVDLFKRVDGYSLPADYCGWYADYKSASSTCGRISASCINSGSYRGCCVGTGSSCASTFYTTCVASSRLTDTDAQCSIGTLCCTGADYPVCGTNLFTSSARPSDTYSLIDCYSAGFDTTYLLQDFQPFTTDADPTDTSTGTSSVPTPKQTPEPSSTPTSKPDPPKKKTPVGAIVGGVIGGVAVIGLIALGALYLYRRRPGASSPSAAGGAAGGGSAPPPNQSYQQDPSVYQQSPMSQQLYPPPAAGGASMYDPRFSYVDPYPGGKPANYANPATGSPPLHSGPPTTAGLGSTPSPDPSSMAGNVSPGAPHGQFVAAEAPTRNPVGVGNNAAELSG